MENRPPLPQPSQNPPPLVETVGAEPRSNLVAGIIAGAVAALIGAAIWAGVAIATGYFLGLLSLGVGLLVAFAVRRVGKGSSPTFGIAAAILALLGTLLGAYLGIVGIGANQEGIPFFELLTAIPITDVPSIIIETSGPRDLLIYLFALYAGYRYTTR